VVVGTSLFYLLNGWIVIAMLTGDGLADIQVHCLACFRWSL